MNKEEIIELVKCGCDPELIAFEFNIPNDEIKQIINEETKKTFLSRESKMNKIRVKYFNQYYSYNSDGVEMQSLEPTQHEKEAVQKVIEYLKREQKNIENMAESTKKDLLRGMLNELKILDTSKLTLEQAEEIEEMLCKKEFENIVSVRRGQKGIRGFHSRRVKTEKTIAQLVEEKAKKTTDVQELRELRKKITPAMAKGNLLIANIKGRIESKITSINSQMVQYEMRNNVSPEIREIVEKLAKGTLDTRKAQQTILEEARKKSEEIKNNPDGRIVLSEQQYERQIAIQIRTLLSEQGYNFPIKDAKKELEELRIFPERISSSQAFKVVVDNLASQEKYKQAMELCDKNISRISFEEGETLISQAARSKKRELKLKQIGSMIKEKIENKVSDEDDQMFMTLLEKRLENEKIKLDTIPIGKDSSQVKTIKLSDIWYEKEKVK